MTRRWRSLSAWRLESGTCGNGPPAPSTRWRPARVRRVALKQRRPGCERPLDLDRIMFYSRSGLWIDTLRDSLPRRGGGLVDEFYLNENNGRDRAHIARILGTFDEAASDGRWFRKLMELAKVHEAPSSPREFARRRDMPLAGCRA